MHAPAATKTTPTIAKRTSCFKITETVPSNAPKARDPVSPINTLAFGALKCKNPKQEPTTEAQTTAKEEVAKLNAEIKLKEKELDDMKKQFDIYKAKMESLLISQLELLKDASKD